MSFQTPTKVYGRGKNSGNPVCRFCRAYLGLKTTSITIFAVTQRQEFKGVKPSKLLSDFGIRLNESHSKSKRSRSCQKCARQIFNSCKFLSHLKINMDDSQPGNLTVKRLAKSSPSASLPEPLNARGELHARKRLSLDKENNPPRNPQDYLEEEMKRLMNVAVEETLRFRVLFVFTKLTTVFVDTRLWKTKHPRKRFQNFRQSCVLSTDGIKIHQSQPASMT